MKLGLMSHSVTGTGIDWISSALDIHVECCVSLVWKSSSVILWQIMWWVFLHVYCLYFISYIKNKCCKCYQHWLQHSSVLHVYSSVHIHVLFPTGDVAEPQNYPIFLKLRSLATSHKHKYQLILLLASMHLLYIAGKEYWLQGYLEQLDCEWILLCNQCICFI